MNKALEKILKKVVIDYPKKFKELNPQEKESVLRICRYIGDIIGYDTIRVETQNTDIDSKPIIFTFPIIYLLESYLPNCLVKNDTISPG